MITMAYLDFKIIIRDDHQYSPDSIVSYSHIYTESSDYRPNSNYAILVYKKDKLFSSAIIIETGGATIIHDKSFLVKNDTMFICCGNMVYALKLPNLSLKWKEKLDDATCFGICEFHGDLVVHGEVEISRLGLNGKIKWQFSARDIFVTLDGRNAFEIIGDTINLLDFEGYEYHLDSDGNEIS